MYVTTQAHLKCPTPFHRRKENFLITSVKHNIHKNSIKRSLFNTPKNLNRFHSITVVARDLTVSTISAINLFYLNNFLVDPENMQNFSNKKSEHIKSKSIVFNGSITQREKLFPSRYSRITIYTIYQQCFFKNKKLSLKLLAKTLLKPGIFCFIYFKARTTNF